MAKRLTDTDIWKSQRWFRKLDPLDKLAFCYIKDQCNHAGIWRIDCSDLLDDLGISEFNLKKFTAAINEEFDKISGNKIIKHRVVILKSNFLWLTGFIQFQYENKEGKVNAESAPVKTALQILQGLDVLEQALLKGYITLIQGAVRAKDIVIVKDIVKDTNSSIKKKAAKKEKTIIPAFNTMPTKADITSLPEQYVTSSIELIFRVNRHKVDPDTILGLWEVFRTQHLTGHNYYANAGKVYSHFLNTMKTIKLNGTSSNQQGGIEKSVTTSLSKRRW
jgi:hypothetical protein